MVKGFRKKIKVVCESQFFTLTINLLIIFNTLILALDKYPANTSISSELDIINIIFFGIFLLEMLIKITGLGPVAYVRDYYNIFDALIGKELYINFNSQPKCC
jgi:hypothetical protein